VSAVIAVDHLVEQGKSRPQRFGTNQPIRVTLRKPVDRGKRLG
jgi:hypothetical protein